MEANHYLASQTIAFNLLACPMVRLSQNKSNICTWPVTLFINSHLRFAFQLKLLSRKLESVLHKTISSCEELVGDTSTIPCSIQIIPIKHLHLCGKKQKFRLFFFFWSHFATKLWRDFKSSCFLQRMLFKCQSKTTTSSIHRFPRKLNQKISSEEEIEALRSNYFN